MIPSLDGLRALSFVLVFLAHVGVRGIPGGFGVTVFFFLSGYLITTLLDKEFETSGTIHLGHFYLRRALRIWPAFYLVLGLFTALTAFGLHPGTLTTPAVVAQSLHYSNFYIIEHGWQGTALGSGVYWSLAVEEHFYLIFPAFYLILRRLGLSKGAMSALFVTLCVATLAWRYHLHSSDPMSSDRTYVGSDTRFDSILFGSLLATAKNPFSKGVARTAPSALEYGALALGVMALLGSFVLRTPLFRETLRYTLQGCALLPVFWFLVAHPTSLVARPLNHPKVAFFGQLTFSLYLIHHLLLESLHKAGLRGVGLAGGAFVLSLAFALVSYRFIEHPLHSVRKKFGPRAKSATPTATPGEILVNSRLG